MTYKVPVCVRPEYSIFLQNIEGSTWAHCDVRKWSASIARRLTQDADTIFSLHGGPMFAMNEPVGCKKHQKFLRLMGFQFLKMLPGLDGQQIPIFRRG